MRTSHSGRAAIAREEACVLPAYKDSVGVWTIGIGHTTAAGPPTVGPGLRLTLDDAFALFARDLAKYEDTVNKRITVKLTQYQFDALVSLCYNIGPGNFAKSTLARKLNVGDYAAAAGQFAVWNKAGGKVVDGLTTRRKRERAIFEHGDYGDISRLPVYQSWPGHPIAMALPHESAAEPVQPPPVVPVSAASPEPVASQEPAEGHAGGIRDKVVFAGGILFVAAVIVIAVILKIKGT